MEALGYVAEVWEEEVWPPSSPNCKFFCYFVCGESEVWVIEKSHNKTKDLIQKMKEVLLLLQSNRMIFSCAVSFESKKKNIPDLSLPPCRCHELITSSPNKMLEM